MPKDSKNQRSFEDFESEQKTFKQKIKKKKGKFISVMMRREEKRREKKKKREKRVCVFLVIEI